jgi:hypothetical protein
MGNRTLRQTLYYLWPDIKWTPVETGFEKAYVGSLTPYELVVEWRNTFTYVTLSRSYALEGPPISVVGASEGNTSEGLKRAYNEAKLAWLLLHALPKEPRLSTEASIEEDVAFFKRYLKG